MEFKVKNKIFAITFVIFTGIVLLASVIGCSTGDKSPQSSTNTAKTPAAPSLASTSFAVAPISTAKASTSQPATRTITDMYGNTITIPAKINRVISTGPVETQLIYMLAPDKLAGVNGTPISSFWNASWDGTAPYIPGTYLDQALGGPIPDVGDASSQQLNWESVLAANPDIVLEGKKQNIGVDQSYLGNIPVVGVNAGNDLLTDYGPEITFVGNLLGVPDKAKALLDYYNQAMSYVNGITRSLGITYSDTGAVTGNTNSETRAYYAEGNDGLGTDSRGSWHTDLLSFCGGYNVADVGTNNTSGTVTASPEQIIAWNQKKPIDMIIIGRASDQATYSTIMNPSNPDFNYLECVKNGHVYIRPDNPTSWFDGPPGYGQILGMYWMVHLLYPNKTADLNLNAEITNFYSDFLHYNLSNAQINELLSEPTTITP